MGLKVIDDLRDLYKSIMEGKKEDVLCIMERNKEVVLSYGKLGEPPSYPLTPRNDSVLHLAVQMGHESLAIEILRKYRVNESLLQARNNRKDTILHEAAGTKMTPFVKELFKFPPSLLGERNKYGETPLFKAALYGQTEMFKLLHDKMKKDNVLSSEHLKREDKATVLHVAILAGFFDLALEIAKGHPDLTEAKDGNQMTALQILSSTPSAFKSGSDYGILEKFIYKCIPDKDTIESDQSRKIPDNYEVCVESEQRRKIPDNYEVCVDCLSLLARSICSEWPMARRIKNEKKEHESAFKLACVLIKEDLSWEETCSGEELNSISLGLPRAGEQVKTDDGKAGAEDKEKAKTGDAKAAAGVKVEAKTDDAKPAAGVKVELKTDDAIAGAGNKAKDETSSSSQTGGGNGGGKEGSKKRTLTPLLLAARHGIVEIVDKILEEHPQAIKHVSPEGQNILHVAIKYRQLEIFHRVNKRALLMAMLARRFDNYWHTILHHVGIMPSCTGGHTQATPAFSLQEELRWFERVRKIVPPQYELHRSKKGKTAFELFVEKHEELLKEARKWLMQTSESCSIAAVLIAAVAFAAAYAVPGGSNKQNGISIVTHDPFFLVFLVMDVISLASSLTSLVMFLSILRSPFQLQAFRHSLPWKLIFGLTFLFFSVAVAMLAFVAAIVLNIHLNKGWTTTLICSAAFLPVPIFALLQFPLPAAFGSTLKFCGNVISTIRRKSSPSCLSNNTTEAQISKNV